MPQFLHNGRGLRRWVEFSDVELCAIFCVLPVQLVPLLNVLLSVVRAAPGDAAAVRFAHPAHKHGFENEYHHPVDDLVGVEFRATNFSHLLRCAVLDLESPVRRGSKALVRNHGVEFIDVMVDIIQDASNRPPATLFP